MIQTALIWGAVGFALGTITSAFYLSTQSRRILRFLNHKNTQRRLDDGKCKTLLPALNELTDYFMRQEHHFIESIAAAGAETEALMERYQLLAENIAAAIVIRDQSGKIQYCSKFTEVLTGYALGEIYEHQDDFFLAITHQEDRESFKRALTICSCGEAFLLRFRFLHKAGFELWGEMRTVPILDSNGSVSSSLSIILDVTGAVRYQKQIEEKNRDLHEFSYMLTHDLKTPILTIKGMLNVITEDFSAELSPELKELYKHITESTQRLEKLVAGVLEYTKITGEEACNQEVDLNSLINDVLDDYQATCQKHQIQISVDRLPIIISDRTKVYQIFSNLLGNALKYRDSNRQSQITVKLVPTDTPHLVKISISDNGIGIPQNKLQDIFRPFQRAHKGAIAGLGIGLASVKKLLDKIDGEIEVESIEYVGSTFTISLRQHQEQADFVMP